MPKIPEDEIETLHRQVDILALFSSYGITLKKKGDDYFGLCPWHEEKTPSLSVSPARNLFHCLGCGEKGNAFQLVQKMEKLPFPEAFEKVAALSPVGSKRDLKLVKLRTPAGVVAEAAQSFPVPSAALPQKRRLEALEWAASEMRRAFDESPLAKAYLAEARGLSLIVKAAQSGAVPLGFLKGPLGQRLHPNERLPLVEVGLLRENGSSAFEGCLTFPLCDATGLLHGFYGRKITSGGRLGRGDPQEGRHYYMKGERSGVYSLHDGKSDTVFLTESVLDALSLYQIGISSVLALHGVNGFSPAHEAWLQAKSIREVYLLLDGDAAGREASVRLSSLLKEKGFKTHILQLPEGEDPNSFFCLGAQAQSAQAPGGSSRTLADLRSLPGYPPQSGQGAASRAAAASHAPAASKAQTTPPESLLIVEGEEYHLEVGPRRYSVKGLSAQGLDRLRVTLRCALLHRPERFFIDSLDLYSARHRAAFIEGAAKEMKAEAGLIGQDVQTLIVLLEKERLRLRQEGAADTGKKAPPMSPSDEADAVHALRSKSLIADFLRDMKILGMVGEEKAKILGILGTVSRLLPKPLGLLILSRSGAGKTTLQEAICSLIPEECLEQYTRLTGQALFYKDKDSLKHKVLAIEEEAGMEQALYAIRTLQSSQRLTVAATRSDPKTGRLRTEEYTVEGPVFLILSTTNPNALDGETKNRFIILTIDESREQTARILEYEKQMEMEEDVFFDEKKAALLRRYHNMQRLLKPLKVKNPFLPDLEWPVDMLQNRREWKKYTGLLKSIALLHQYQRPLKTMTQEGRSVEYIEVALEDIALANELTYAFFPHALEELAPHTRTLGEEVGKLVEHKGGEVRFTRKELREFTLWSDWSCRQGLEQLLELGYIQKVAGAQGLQNQYEMLVDVRAERRKKPELTSVDTLRLLVKNRQKTRTGGENEPK